MPKIPTVIFLFIFVPLSGCSTNRFLFSQSEDDLRSTLLLQIPVGTPEDEVRNFLKTEYGVKTRPFYTYEVDQVDSQFTVPVKQGEKTLRVVLAEKGFPCTDMISSLLLFDLANLLKDISLTRYLDCF